MASIYNSPPPTTFKALLAHLNSLPPPLLPPGKPQDATLSDTIASLYLHPAIESLLHILNHDLPSAHFLVRHMQSPPAYEGMYMHGILHRIEGDMDNARAWYSDVCGWEGFLNFWGKPDEGLETEEDGRKLPQQRSARDFLDAVEGCINGKKDDLGGLAERSRAELDSLMDWCVGKFGTEAWKDATKVWVQPSEEISQMGEDQVSGDGGPRNF